MLSEIPTEQIIKELEEVEKVQSTIFSEALDVYGPLLTSPTSIKRKENVDKTIEREKYVNSLFWRLAKWWFIKKKKYLDYLTKLMTLPPAAYMMKEQYTSFYIRNRKGERIEIRVQYTPYDLLEFIGMYVTLKDAEGRKKVVDLTVELAKTQVVYDAGKAMTVKEYVEDKLGMKWSDFEAKLRKLLDASISNYLKEIDTTDGSPLAKHIHLRDRAIQTGDISYLWLYAFGQSFSLSLMSLAAKIYYAKLPKVSRDKAEKEAVKFYKYVGRFNTVIEHLTYEELDAVREMKKKLVFKPEIDVDTARKEFERIRRTAQEALFHAGAEYIPPEVIVDMHKLPMNKGEMKTIAKSRISNEEDLNLYLE